MTTRKERDYLIYRWRWDNFARLKITETVPIHLDLELNSNCNYTCIMCPFHGNRQVDSISMPFDMVKKIIDEFGSKDGDSIKFVYRGEPLLYNDLVNVIAYAKSNGILDTIVNTNGMLLNKDMAKNLILEGLDKLIFSIDSSKAETYAKIRRGGNFYTVMRNVIMIQSLKQFCGSELPITKVQCLVQDLNKEEVESGEFENFWKELVDEVIINYDCFEHERNDIVDPTPDFRCESVWLRLTIRANGDIALCCGIDSDDKILGNIEDDTIEAIWNGSVMNNIRALITSGKAHLIPACRTCDLRRKYLRGYKNDYKI